MLTSKLSNPPKVIINALIYRLITDADLVIWVTAWLVERRAFGR